MSIIFFYSFLACHNCLYSKWNCIDYISSLMGRSMPRKENCFPASFLFEIRKFQNICLLSGSCVCFPRLVPEMKIATNDYLPWLGNTIRNIIFELICFCFKSFSCLQFQVSVWSMISNKAHELSISDLCSVRLSDNFYKPKENVGMIKHWE